MSESAQDKVNRILRDHEGYEGDGKGHRGALPIGDPTTRVKPISKRDLREALIAPLQETFDARDKAQEWAEGTGEPGGPGTKSSKSWAGEAEADRIQTGLDRVATGQDRVQTGLDAVATAADRVATGQDRVQTGLDRVATGQDRVATGQDKTDAQTARTQAQTAQGLAEDAQGFAEDAQAAAEAAFRDFDKRYLGPYPAAPTLDLNGDPVVTGALYFDTVIGALRVYDGSGWVTISTAGALLASANLSDVDSAATSRTNLGLGTAATVDHGTDPGEVPLNSDLGTMAVEDAADYVTKASKATQGQAEGGVTGDVWMDDIRVRQAIAQWAIGVGQTWVNVTAQRTTGTSYQNTTGRPIQVAVSGNGASGRRAEVSANGTAWITICGWPGARSPFFAIPAGHFYRVSIGVTIDSWAELK